MTVMNVTEGAVSGFGEPLDGDLPVVPNISETKITSPADGATVPLVFDIEGTGTPGNEVTLWFQFLDPEGPVQSTGMTRVIDEDGNFAYAGDTPSDPGEVEWFTRSAYGESPHVKVTVKADDPPPE